MTDHRLFFAVQPDGDTARRIAAFAAALRRDHHLGGAVRPPELLHVTLALVGRTPEPPDPDAVDVAMKAGAGVTARPFVVALNRVQTWTPVVLVGDEGVIGLELLHAELARALGQAPDPGFTAHMSLIWNAGPLADHAVPPVRWTVREFVLIHSIRGESRHDVLGRWPLSIQAPSPKNA